MKAGRIIESNARRFNTGTRAGGAWRQSTVSERRRLCVDVTAGEIALYGFLILVVITVATFIPYRLWRWTHRLMGLFFAFGAFHYLFILKPFSVGDPLGRFLRPRSRTPELWIADGIGITPFVAWAQAMDPRDGPAHLVYCVRDEASAAHLDELEVLAETLPNLTLTLHASHELGRATVETILETTGRDAPDLSIAFCGPEPMRKALAGGFAARGVSVRKLRYEVFEIRSGIGLAALAAYLTDRMKPPRRAAIGEGGTGTA